MKGAHCFINMTWILSTHSRVFGLWMSSLATIRFPGYNKVPWHEGFTSWLWGGVLYRWTGDAHLSLRMLIRTTIRSSNGSSLFLKRKEKSSSERGTQSTHTRMGSRAWITTDPAERGWGLKSTLSSRWKPLSRFRKSWSELCGCNIRTYIIFLSLD